MPQPINQKNLAPIEPLSAGNVVTTALRLYRSHLKLYLGLSFKSLLWYFVPVYGWAKASKINAIISRLAFGELINQPETLKEINQKLKGRLWSFLGCQILINLMLGLINIGTSFVASILSGIIMLIVVERFAPIISLVLNIVGWAVYLWFFSRWFIPELPLVVEKNSTVSYSIERSWTLTTNSVWRIQLILLLGSLITLPLILLGGIPILIMFFQGLAALNSVPYSDGPAGLLFLSVFLFIIFIMVSNMFFVPFWQAMKAIIYYDLLSRREGIDLQLRDRKI